MELYLAGLEFYIQKRLMELYLASGNDKRLAGEHDTKNGKIMDLYTTGENGKGKIMDSPVGKLIQALKSPLWDNISVLESFYYARQNKFIEPLFKKGAFKKIILDSGAFTFLQSKQKEDWEQYTREYGRFVRKWNIENFFELDIYSIIGTEKTEHLRDILQDEARRPPIPVWHRQLGKEYFIDLCKKYNYVAIGGFVIKEIQKNEYNQMKWFIKTAHDNGAKIHGLGFTKQDLLPILHFDSVDSTAWLYGNRAGYLYKFNYQKGKMEKISKPNTRLKGELAAIWNFNEWLKYQDYARKKL